MYNNTLHRGEKHFIRYFLQVFSKAGRLKRYVNDCFRIDGTQMIMPKKVNMLDLKLRT